jgi:hypothetical protein
MAFNRRSTLPRKAKLDPRPNPQGCADNLDLNRSIAAAPVIQHTDRNLSW